MGYMRHIFYQPECDYPGCGKLLHVESAGQSIGWFYDVESMNEAVEGTADRFIALKGADGNQIGMVRTGNKVNRNLVLLDNEDNPRFFCPDHVLMRNGKPVGFDPSTPEHRPQSDELAEHYEDWGQPLPKLECEQNILNVLKNPTPEEPTQVGFYVTQDRKYVLTYSPWTGWKHSRLDGTANDALPWNGQNELSTDDWCLVVDNLGEENLPLIPLGDLFSEEEA